MAGALFDLGDFRSPDFQEILGAPAKLMDAVETIDTIETSPFTYIGYVPYGGLVPAYTGTGDIVTEIVKRTAVSTLAGTFNDAVEVSFTTTWVDDSPSAGTRTITVWLARDIGPVSRASWMASRSRRTGSGAAIFPEGIFSEGSLFSCVGSPPGGISIERESAQDDHTGDAHRPHHLGAAAGAAAGGRSAPCG